MSPAQLLELPAHRIGPIDGIDYRVALGYYPEGATVARWDSARWDTAGAAWQGAPPHLDVSCQVLSVHIAQGRDLPLERFRPGTCTVIVDDPEGVLSPWRTAPETGTYAAIRPGIDLVVWCELTEGTSIGSRFVGIVDAITDLFPDPDSHQVRFDALDLASLLAAYDGLEQNSQGNHELPGARLHRIADSASYTGTRAFDVGTVTLQATTLAKNAWDEAGLVCDTETGALFCDRAGRLVFLDRNGLVGDPHYTAVQATFGEVEPEICYTAIELATDSTKIKNVVSIAREGGNASTVTNPDSIALYRPRTYRRFDLIHDSNAESAVIAQRHLDFYAFAANRVEQLRVDLTVLPAAHQLLVLALDVLWRIQVRRRATGVQIVADLQIEAIKETVTAHSCELTFTTFDAASVFDVGRWDRASWDSGKWGY